MILVRHYLPGVKAGGPCVSVANLIAALSNQLEFEVITLDRDAGDTSAYPELRHDRSIRVGNANVHYLAPGPLLALRLLAKIRDLKFEVLYINSFFERAFSIGVMFWIYLGLIRAQCVILAPRNELASVSLAFKPMQKRLFIFCARLLKVYAGVVWHATDANEARGIRHALERSVLEIRIASNIPEIGEMQSRQTLCRSFLPVHGGSALRVIVLSRISKEKNIPYALEILQAVTAQVEVCIYGAIEDPAIWRVCEKMIADMRNNVKVRYGGVLSRRQLQSELPDHDILLLPTTGENYGHAIVECMLAGIPAVISDQTPWRELAVDGLGWDIPLKEKKRFSEVIDAIACGNLLLAKRAEVRRAILRRLNCENILRDNIELFTAQGWSRV